MMSARNDRSEVGSPRARSLVRGVLAVVILSLVMAPGAALAGTQNVAPTGQVSPLVDAVLLRPLGLITTLGGTMLFLVAVPLVLLTRPSEMAIPFEVLVMKPVRYTWLDPLGDHAVPVD